MHPAASTPTESKLAARHLSFTFEPNLRLDQIRDVEGNQVRLGKHRAPKEMVERYAEQMKGGAIFPAIVVNDRYEIVDGNTRWMAVRRNRKETIPSYVCANLSALEARSLSVELNQSHGLSMTQEELHGFVTGAVEEGKVLNAKAYSRMTGVKPATLARWVAAKQFEMRAARENIPEQRLDRLSDSVRAALQVAKLSAVFAAVTQLAVDARVPVAQLKTIITEANTASSEADAREVVARARDARSDDIKAIAAGFKSAKRKGIGSALHIGGLLRFEVSALLDVPREKQSEMFERMTLLRDRLDGALTRAGSEWDLTEPDADDRGASRALAEVR
ncbi:MAG: ParB/Sulfiredoxin domain [Solirubrobacteraceae bacterium]|jgi:hypothetical protein|nr:ParB/Sulfiredoxin domain [Solirubrobacteraceae bacterium]